MMKVVSIAERNVNGYRNATEFVVEATRTRVLQHEFSERLEFDDRKRSIPRKIIDKQGGPE